MNYRHPVSLAQAMWRGFTGNCPSCGEKHLFNRFLKVADSCDSCGEALHHQQADDFPAYLVAFIVGHTMIPLCLFVEFNYSPPYWLHLALWLPLMLVMAIGLLQPIKGAIVALQWHLGMHGFDASKTLRDQQALNAMVPSMEAKTD